MPDTNIVSMPQRPAGITTAKVKRDFTQDYVAQSGYSSGQNRILGATEDDVELEISLETYDRMENDPVIAKCKNIIITNTLTDEMQMAPGATEDEVGKEDYQVYVEIMEFCQRVIIGLDRPYREFCEQQLNNAVPYGHAIAEVTWEYRKDGWSSKPEQKDKKLPTTKIGALWAKMGGLFMATPSEPEDPAIKRPQLKKEKIRLMPKSIKVKPRGTARFVVDDFMNVLGIAPMYSPNRLQLKYDEIVDREKFLVLTLHKKNEDPRGKSTYRPAFNWYNLKTQMPSELLRFILEELVPKVVATLPENATPFEMARDDDNNIIYEDEANTVPKMISLAESLRNAIKEFRGGSGVVVPFGVTFEPFKKGLTGAADASMFNQTTKLIDGQIENSILNQTLAQSEGEHQARSASQQVAELLYNLIFWIRWLLAVMTLTDLLEVAVKKNFGEWALKYMPFVSFGDFVRRDWATDLEIISRAYFWGFIDDTQRAELMAWLNLPKPGPSRQELGLEATAQADVNGDPVVPNKNRPDKQAGTKNRNKGNGTEKKNGTQADIGFSPLNFLGHHGRRIRGVTRNIFKGQ